MDFIYIVSVLTAIFAVVIAYFKWSFTYWKRKGLPYLEPSIPAGNISKMLLQKFSFAEQWNSFYQELKKRGLKHGGVYMFSRPVYVVNDPEIVKHVLLKDFEYFTDRGMYVNEEHDPLAANLFSLDGAKWKNLRVKLTPTFTSGKMRMMFHTLTECSKGLKPLLLNAQQNKKPIDIKETMGLFTTDVISSCAFGIDSNCLKDPDNDIRKYGKKSFENGIIAAIKGSLVQFSFPHNTLIKLGVKITDNEVEKFFMNLVKKNVEYRKNNNITRNDFFQLLIQLKDSDPSFTMESLSAQAFVFFLAGFETSSTTTMFTMYELARNQDIQNKLREEIKKVLASHNNELSYEAMMDMPYLDQCINETLRKYPPVPALWRRSSKPWKIPDTDKVLDKGTHVFISLVGLQNDPDYFPNPDQFDPDRFSNENKKDRPSILHIPFGEGPRNCIGLRFGLMQTKVGIINFLLNYKYSLNDKTKVPFTIDCQSLIYSPKGGIWLNVEKLS